jgi:hypothetical protein
VVAGRLNKQIAADLGTVENTIKVHRARVMEKMAVASLAALVRVAVQIGLGPAGPGSADNNGASLRGLEMDHAVRDRL